MIIKNICLKDYTDFSSGETWGLIFGVSDNEIISHYTGQTSDAYIIRMPILLTTTIDNLGILTAAGEPWVTNTKYNIGNVIIYDNKSYICITEHISGDEFSMLYWSSNMSIAGPILMENGNLSITEGGDILTNENEFDNYYEYDITYTGETKISNFARYGKTVNDEDLYNPIWNSGFTHTINVRDNILMQLTNERTKVRGLSKQNLYDYKMYLSDNPNISINYEDINNTKSKITYKSGGLTPNNSIETSKVKLEYLIGVEDAPKINADIFIDRGNNSSFDRHLRLGDIKSTTDLRRYGNGYFNIKEA